ncbi:serine hydrolase [Streptomyces sp. AC495_CC817]|uniref:serine hydrolase domain-containing protein n=1 Tax=Streptomyces sp. AC495_CC817 TaxID=2823900 RepID=UPI001C267889|nr:serine hydrolase domain-containing protein [Streptomyces sp. AC495_CC817]
MKTDLTQLVSGVTGPGRPGLAIGLYRDGRLIDHAEAGEASIEFGVPVDADTRFEIASMSKQFTAAAVLLLCRDGKLSLDDDVRRHLPELSLAVPVTVRQCLEHTGGLREWLSSADMAGVSMTRITQDQTLAFVAGFRELNFAPGDDFSYSNTGYVLAASLVQRITGQTLGAFAAARIFEPLGMTRTLFREDSRAVIPQFAYGYMSAGEEIVRADTEECAVGDGGIATSLADLGPWFGFLGDGRVLGVDIRDGLLQRGVLNDGTAHTYARGIYHVDIAGRPAFGHAGGAMGYRTQLLYVPGEDLGVAVLTNTSAYDPVALSAQALEQALGAPAPEPVEFIDDADAAAVLAGHWIDRSTEFTIAIEEQSGRLRSSGLLLEGELALAGDGGWRGLGDLAPLRLDVVGDTLEAVSPLRPGRGSVFERCAAPDASATPPAGVYRSPELGTYAVIGDDGALAIGLHSTGQLEPAPDGAFSAAGFTVRADGDDILVTSWGARRVRFERQPDGEGPRGIPAGLTA